jgi:hypothetical protein
MLKVIQVHFNRIKWAAQHLWAATPGNDLRALWLIGLKVRNLWPGVCHVFFET